jgi:hypothetical protein
MPKLRKNTLGRYARVICLSATKDIGNPLFCDTKVRKRKENVSET